MRHFGLYQEIKTDPNNYLFSPILVEPRAVPVENFAQQNVNSFQAEVEFYPSQSDLKKKVGMAGTLVFSWPSRDATKDTTSDPLLQNTIQLQQLENRKNGTIDHYGLTLYVSTLDGLEVWQPERGGYIRPILGIATLSEQRRAGYGLLLRRFHDVNESFPGAGKSKNLRLEKVHGSAVFNWSVDATSLKLGLYNREDFVSLLFDLHNTLSTLKASAVTAPSTEVNSASRDIVGLSLRDYLDNQSVHVLSVPLDNESCADSISDWLYQSGVCDTECVAEKQQSQSSFLSERQECKSLASPDRYYSASLFDTAEVVDTCEGQQCHPGETCVEPKESGDKRACGCRDGYTRVAGKCQDINECVARTATGLSDSTSKAERSLQDVCSANSVCVNLPGSFACACAYGYIESEPGNCTAKSSCVAYDAFGHCQCHPGFQTKQEAADKRLRLVTAKRTKESESSSVGTPNWDTVRPSSLSETPTADGYDVGDLTECEDIDECIEGSASCHFAATCLNLDGGYICSCRQGYEGDGHTCVSGTPAVDLYIRFILTQEDVDKYNIGFLTTLESGPVVDGSNQSDVGHAPENVKSRDRKSDVYMADSFWSAVSLPSWISLEAVRPGASQAEPAIAASIDNESSKGYVQSKQGIRAEPVTADDKDLGDLFNVLKHGLSQGLDISDTRIRLVQRLKLSENIPNWAGIEPLVYQCVVRLEPLGFSNPKRSELTSYQATLELSRQLNVPLLPDHLVPIKDPRVVGGKFANLTRFMYLDRYELVSKGAMSSVGEWLITTWDTFTQRFLSLWHHLMKDPWLMILVFCGLLVILYGLCSFCCPCSRKGSAKF